MTASEPQAERNDRPWEDLERLAAAEDWPAVRALLDALDSEDRSHALSHLDAECLAQIFLATDPDHAARWVDDLPEIQAATALDELEPHDAAEILGGARQRRAGRRAVAHGRHRGGGGPRAAPPSRRPPSSCATSPRRRVA